VLLDAIKQYMKESVKNRKRNHIVLIMLGYVAIILTLGLLEQWIAFITFVVLFIAIFPSFAAWYLVSYKPKEE
jgi:uncharacterized membrane protein